MLPSDGDALTGRPPRRGVLADGREIFYFDDPGRRAQLPRADQRPPDPAVAPGELRHDPLLDEPVIVATHRQGRTHLPPSSECPLCPSTSARLTEIPEPSYDVVVFENRFPSLPATDPDGTAAGRCEVISYSSDHELSFATLPPRRLATISEAWVHRTEALAALPGTAYVLAFENRGEEIGVTLHHPHGQIYAYPYLPPRIERMVAVAARHSGCVACDELVRELAGERIVHETAHAVAYVPWSARWPYEVHVVPRRHVGDLGKLTSEERLDLVTVQANVLRRLDRVFERRVPYMAGWLQAPMVQGRERWHLRHQVVTPQRDAGKLKYLASSESLAGAFINDVRPEVAAARLRDAGEA